MTKIQFKATFQRMSLIQLSYRLSCKFTCIFGLTFDNKINRIFIMVDTLNITRQNLVRI